MSLKQEGAGDVVKSADSTLSLAVLRGSVRAGHTEVYAVTCEELDEGGVNELSTVIGLEEHDREVELCACISYKVNKNITGVGFTMKGESPHKMREIIDNDKVIFQSRITRNW